MVFPNVRGVYIGQQMQIFYLWAVYIFMVLFFSIFLAVMSLFLLCFIPVENSIEVLDLTLMRNNHYQNEATGPSREMIV